MKQKYYPLYQNKFPHTVGSNKITKEGFNFSPAIYEDDERKEIYFVGNYDGYASVFKIEYDKEAKEWSESQKIIQGEKSEVFESFHLLQLSLTTSEDGKVAFVTKSGGTDAIHIYSIEEEEVIETFKWDNIISIKSPSFSNDDGKIVFNGMDQKGYSDLFIIDITSKELVRITNDYYDDKDPVFSKHDETIVFASDRTEGFFEQSYNLFEIDLETHDIEYITYANANFGTPHFTPDFSDLYFTSDYDGVYNIWKLEREKETPTGMTLYSNFVTSIYDFDFFDNSKIVTSAFQEFSLQFYEFDLDRCTRFNKEVCQL
ncbi:MAG: hypothetical protein U5K00_02650 [Melioribacteraceae bacterium]|nr:hypothetical protein [Melioribacteraceae bacterium]